MDENSEVYKSMIVNSNSPLIFESLANRWDQMYWNSEKWCEVFVADSYPFRSASRICSKIVRSENDCDVVFMNMPQFFEEANNPVKCTEKWFYFDYKNINKWIIEQNFEAFSNLHWGCVGFPEKNINDSYIWIGSAGAYTSCHYDTYGFNIIAQIYGRKRWILFPQSEGKNLKPTRVPFEESTVNSKLNFVCKSGIKGVKFDNCYVVDLNPGDILYVPPRWWHFVTNLTTAISTNIWIPVENDHVWRLEESLVRGYIYSVTQSLPPEEKLKFINRNEDLEENLTNSLILIKHCVDQLGVSEDLQLHSIKPNLNSSLSNISSYPNIKHPRHCTGEIAELISCQCDGNVTQNKSDVLSLEHLIDSFCHPDVIIRVKEMLLNNIYQSL